MKPGVFNEQFPQHDGERESSPTCAAGPGQLKTMVWRPQMYFAQFNICWESPTGTRGRKIREAETLPGPPSPPPPGQ